MNVRQVVRAVTKKTRYREEAVEEILNAAFEILSDALVEQGRIYMRPIGRLQVRIKTGKRFFNPQTRQYEVYRDKKVVVYSPSPRIRDQLKLQMEDACV